MKNKKRIVVFALTASVLLSGCSLTREMKYEEVRPVIISSEVEEMVEDDIVAISYVNLPRNEVEKEKLIEFITSLTRENEIVVFDGKNNVDNSGNLLSYSEDVFSEALKINPMVQIYYCGNANYESSEQATISLYPNVTYVKEKEDVAEVIIHSYKANKICSSLIVKCRKGKEKVEKFNLEEAITTAKENIKNIDTEDILNGLDEFNQYVQNTKLFQMCEEVSDKTMEILKPYVESAIPKVESAYESVKPYIEKGADKVGEIYKDIKPELEEAYEKSKEKVKSIFGNKE